MLDDRYDPGQAREFGERHGIDGGLLTLVARYLSDTGYPISVRANRHALSVKGEDRGDGPPPSSESLPDLEKIVPGDRVWHRDIATSRSIGQ